MLQARLDLHLIHITWPTLQITWEDWSRVSHVEAEDRHKDHPKESCQRRQYILVYTKYSHSLQGNERPLIMNQLAIIPILQLSDTIGTPDQDENDGHAQESNERFEGCW